MALSFATSKGGAVSKKVDTYTYKDGENTLRLVGGILPRYVYWVKGTNDKDIPVECLAFNRDKEKFDNLEVDHVAETHPDLKCSWSYTMNCIDPTDGKVKVLPLKKKLFAQIRDAAADLGDPTDPDEGWDVVFKRAKTGPLAYNIEYTLSVLRCKKRPLNETERAAVAAADTIDTKYPRATPAEVLALLTRLSGDDSGSSPSVDKEAVDELG